MATASKEREELDLRGQVCPAALFRSLKKFEELHVRIASGECELAILTDNRDSVPTISDAARNMGYAVTVELPEGHYLLRVAAEAPAGGGEKG